MREWLKSAAVEALYGCLHLFRLCPVRARTVFFSAYAGKRVTCNPEAVCKKLRALYGDEFKIEWCVRDEKSRRALDAQGFKTVGFNTLAYFFRILTAKAVVLNDLSGCSYLPFGKRQTVVQTWHGCGLYKKVGHDVPNETAGYHRRLRRIAKQIDLFTSGSTTFTKTVIRGAFGYTGDVMETGLARNDSLLDEAARESANAKVRAFYGFGEKTPLILFAPTFRQDSDADEMWFEDDAVKTALQSRFPNYKVLVRTHYMAKEAQSQTALDVTAYPDMQELLCAADVLVSDYSSCIWDFSLTEKPCFLYAPDLSDYQCERDFYLDIHKWPFPLAETTEELAQQLLQFDVAAYTQAVRTHLSELGSRESGRAAESLCEFVAEKAR